MGPGQASALHIRPVRLVFIHGIRGAGQEHVAQLIMCIGAAQAPGRYMWAGQKLADLSSDEHFPYLRAPGTAWSFRITNCCSTARCSTTFALAADHQWHAARTKSAAACAPRWTRLDCYSREAMYRSPVPVAKQQRVGHRPRRWCTSRLCCWGRRTAVNLGPRALSQIMGPVFERFQFGSA